MSGRWVCLMYHDVTATSLRRGASDAFSVSADTFGGQLSLIEEAGLSGCTIATAVDRGAQRCAAISFDDGNIGQYANAFPSLVAHRMAATFFITTGWVGRPGFVTWEHLREMRAAGMAIESHTHTHPFLSELSEGELREELRRSRDLLGDNLGEPPSMIALPGGDAPRRDFGEIFVEEGYRVVANSCWGLNRLHVREIPRSVRRCTVRGELNPLLYMSVLRGDAWLGSRKRTRELTLAALRRSLGPSRYARWRRGLLDFTGAWLTG